MLFWSNCSLTRRGSFPLQHSEGCTWTSSARRCQSGYNTDQEPDQGDLWAGGECWINHGSKQLKIKNQPLNKQEQYKTLPLLVRNVYFSRELLLNLRSKLRIIFNPFLSFFNKMYVATESWNATFYTNNCPLTQTFELFEFVKINFWISESVRWFYGCLK